MEDEMTQSADITLILDNIFNAVQTMISIQRIANMMFRNRFEAKSTNIWQILKMLTQRIQLQSATNLYSYAMLNSHLQQFGIFSRDLSK